MEGGTVGQIVDGKFGNVLVRQKAGEALEIGDLLVSDEGGHTLVMQVFGLEYGSQIHPDMRQVMAGESLERGGAGARFYSPETASYVVARVKPLARLSSGGDVTLPKSLPEFFGKLRRISPGDLDFLPGREDGVFVGHIRSGTKVMREAGVWLPAEDTFSHHVLIPATTGRGKSNLVKTMLWHLLDSGKVGALVLDAHNEYHSGGKADGYAGLKDHPRAHERLAYYTPSDNPPPGAEKLTINLESVRPEHFESIAELSTAQSEGIESYGRSGRDWIATLVRTDQDMLTDQGRSETRAATLSVLKRKLGLMLALSVDEDGRVVSAHDVFDSGGRGKTTISDMAEQVKSGKVVVVDTSRLGDEAELLVGTMVASKIFQEYKNAKARGALDALPVATVVIEEAPRVIGEGVLASRDNIFSTIAKEGRKFKVGLTAITQLSSVIPKTVLANMNTKIILGNEMKQERDAIVASASQDLSDDDRNIASLNKGEAIVSSIFVPFAVPVKIPLFKDVAGGRK